MQAKSDPDMHFLSISAAEPIQISDLNIFTTVHLRLGGVKGAEYLYSKPPPLPSISPGFNVSLTGGNVVRALF